MGLTRIRAQQISNSDYKQAVRVITLSNISLAGGAPSQVDGVNLSVGDRILVNGQSNAAQNGLYQVQTLGTGENGTWARTSDANQDGEIQPGMVVMVTQGDEYADTPWKLITNGTIIIGTTELFFEENYSLAFGNLFANGTAVVANVVSAALTLTAGDNISIIGNNTTKTVTFSATGGGGGSGTAISNGTSNVDIAIANGNVTTTVNGNNIMTVTDTGANVSGYVTTTGNITSTGAINSFGDLVGNVTFAAIPTRSLNLVGTSAVMKVARTTGTGDPAVELQALVPGNAAVLTYWDFFASGSLDNFTLRRRTGGSNESLLTANSAGVQFPTGAVTVTGNVIGGNLNTGGRVVATGNVTGGNVITAGLVSLSSITKTGSNGVGNIGAAASTFDTVFARATSAQYADVAERYLADRDYTPGTVLEIGGTAEVRATQTSHSTRLVGVVSTAPALIMNSAVQGDHVVTVALLGRTPCKVIGAIQRGDLLVSSDRPGVAMALVTGQYQPGSVIGKALTSSEAAGESVIEVLVGRL